MWYFAFACFMLHTLLPGPLVKVVVYVVYVKPLLICLEHPPLRKTVVFGLGSLGWPDWLAVALATSSGSGEVVWQSHLAPLQPSRRSLSGQPAVSHLSVRKLLPWRPSPYQKTGLYGQGPSFATRLCWPSSTGSVWFAVSGPRRLQRVGFWGASLGCPSGRPPPILHLDLCSGSVGKEKTCHGMGEGGGWSLGDSSGFLEFVCCRYGRLLAQAFQIGQNVPSILLQPLKNKFDKSLSIFHTEV